MEWISIKSSDELPENKTIIVEDVNGWIGQAYKNGDVWSLETFGQISFSIDFDEIIRYFVIPNY